MTAILINTQTHAGQAVAACTCEAENRIPGCLMCAACELRLDAHLAAQPRDLTPDAWERALDAQYDRERARAYGERFS